MNSTSAAHVINHPLWPGPGTPPILDVQVASPDPPTPMFWKYCSRSARRCSVVASAGAAGAATAATGAAAPASDCACAGWDKGRTMHANAVVMNQRAFLFRYRLFMVLGLIAWCLLDPLHPVDAGISQAPEQMPCQPHSDSKWKCPPSRITLPHQAPFSPQNTMPQQFLPPTSRPLMPPRWQKSRQKNGWTIT